MTQALVQGVLVGGQYALFAAGLSLMFGVMRIVNLAHGALAVAGAYLASTAIVALGVPAPVAILLALVVMAGVGWGLQQLVLERTMRSGEFTTPLVTFALSVVIGNVLLMVFGSDVRSIALAGLETASVPITATLSVGWISVLVFAAAVVILGGVQLFLHRTVAGRVVRAAADDSATAALMGVDHRVVFSAVTAFGLVTATIAGVAFGVQSSFDPHAGVLLLLFAFETIVIGGLGSLWGTLVGGIVLGVSQTLAAAVDVQYSLLAGHLVFLAFLFVRPRGIFPGTWQ
ncbi:amino acid/amide ABC transporter membrane protein 1 (HAAT family) [Pseudonocardia hierapolitana]|uniref:Amino acid/amide ABC transporter membrane protein 1 (HAAT family) n=1 Tax=Pseudonocardia hierapolitana TaxID=1128676 RepID=A0A561T1P6_9PSEU|nr:branched-chain amino acid ABC transporter permease [Pseudonocardia hierapolitana]TWF81015.1 amino acid/amide ABC transporter membrane protein 1 (HAAT family) [Pseudonocardia hierapolitana]